MSKALRSRTLMPSSKKKSTVKIESDSDKESYWSSKPLTPASHIHNDKCDHPHDDSLGQLHEEHFSEPTDKIKPPVYKSKIKRAPYRISAGVVELTLNDMGKNQDAKLDYDKYELSL